MSRADNIRTRMREDILKTLRQHGYALAPPILEEIIDDAMFPVEHMLAEIEDLENTVIHTAREAHG